VQERPRIALIEESEISDDIRRALGPFGRRRPLENIFLTLARHPVLLERYSNFGLYIMRGSTLPARDREVVILRVGVRTGSAYEFAQHVRIGRQTGLVDADIKRVIDGPDAPGWTARDANLLCAVDELIDEHMVTDETWSKLGESLDISQLMDLVFTIGTYTLVCWALRSFGVQLDAGLEPPPWPIQKQPDHRESTS
jgi:4-carboxymuconolactone decarboxylase